MRLHAIRTIASASALLGTLGPSIAADIEWDVENPFRFYKTSNAFALPPKSWC